MVGLGNVLGDEPVASQRRFSELVASTTGSIGLGDAVSGPDRSRERAHGRQVRHRNSAEPAPRRRCLDFEEPRRRGPRRDGLGGHREQRTELAGTPGFYLVHAARFGHGPRSRGILAVFTPRGWLTLSLGDDPREVAISLDGQPLEGRLSSAPAASATVVTLGRRWRVDVAIASASGLQSLLPWLALAWPIAAALLAFLIGNAVVRRRRAEREAERIFDFSLDMMGTIGLDGYFKRVDPAFERILGYPVRAVAGPAAARFRASPRRTVRARGPRGPRSGRRGQPVRDRFISRDGGTRWLEWNVRPVQAEGVVYAGARDVTDRRLAEQRAQRAQHMLEASRDELGCSPMSRRPCGGWRRWSPVA